MQSNRQYLNDDTVGTKLEDSPWKTIATTSAMIAGGVVAYKSGLLKHGLSRLFDVAGDMKSAYPHGATVFKNWANQYDKYDDAGKIVKDGIQYKDSLIRNVSLLSFDSLFDKKSPQKGVKSLIEYGKRLANSTERAKIINSTRSDFDDLGKKIREQQNIENRRIRNKAPKQYGDSRLFRTSRVIEESLGKIKKESGRKARDAAERQSSKDFVEDLILTSEKKAEQLKRTEHHNLTVGDAYHISKDKDGNHVLQIKNNSFRLGKNQEKELLHIGSRKVKGKDGKDVALIETNEFRNLIFDDAIFLSEKGKVSDLRKFRDGANGFVRSMASDFQIPIIGINPLRMFGLDAKRGVVNRFGVFKKGTVQSAIKGSTDSLEKSLFFSGGKVYDIDKDGTMNLIKSNVVSHRIFKDSTRLDRELESLRKMSNLDRTDIQRWTKDDGNAKYYYGKAMEKLDLGFSDVHSYTNRKLGLGDYINPNTYIEKLTENLFSKWAKPYKAKDPKYKEFYSVFTKDMANEGEESVFIALNESVRINDVVKGDAHFFDFMGQFVAGRKNLDKVTEATTHSFYLFDRVNTTLNIAGLGMSIKSLGSSQDVLKNLILKRALPVFVAYNAYEYLNYMSENDEDGNNMSKFFATLVVKSRLELAKASDAVGTTDLFKSFSELMPGLDHISELPGVSALKLNKSHEELVDYYQNGYDPIRKGRYWDIGNQAFTGNKISYFKPNWYRRVMADVKFSDSQYGSREEYFANSPIPNILHPLAPLRHFVTDRYHWEEKHYNDRPYLLSSPAFSNVPVVGPMMGATVGRIIKPQESMHKEDLRDLQSQEALSSSGITAYGIGKDLETANGVISSSRMEMSKAGQLRPALYTTASGRVSVVGIGNTTSTYDVRTQLSDKGIKSVLGATERFDMNTGVKESTEDDFINPNNPLVASGNLYNNVTDFIGIYGYSARSMTGRANTGKISIETSGYAQSIGKQFWDSELGGLGGEISEIFRRFIPKRGQDDQYYNPIRNTMPEWMPGSDYFTDFQHGDPYVKIKAGEMRLPGEGYERLHGIKIDNMRIGSSFIGKGRDEIIKHYLNKDPILEGSFADEVTEDGEDMHKAIEKEWLDSGYAIDTEGKIDDQQNNIVGYYDARVVDKSTPEGQAIIDIKTVSDKIFQQVKTSGIQEHHKRQVNYYLWATGLSKGGINYVNRDTGEQLDLSFNFEQETLNRTLEDLHEARKYINDGLQSGAVSRADLYDHLDRYRILADVAPYSKEYKQMNAIISQTDLTPEEEEEVKQIRDRMTQQKKPLRVYDYKFKTADLINKSVRIKRMYDNNTFYVDGYEAPIRLAGIEVKAGDTPEEKERISKYMNEIFEDGNAINIGIDKSENEQIKNGSIRAVVYSKGRNINKELIDLGYAKVNENDDSAAAMHGRYNEAQRTFGAIWETLAHMDTPFHTKFLQVRSPLESYERERIYGKQFTEWSDPLQDFIKPYVVDRNVNRGLLPGVAWGIVIGSLFGRKPQAKMIGGAIGGLTVLAGKVITKAYELENKERWKPERIRKENEINEYMDMLKYIKSKKLFNEYADKALREDGIDVRAFVGSKKSMGRGRKKDKKEMEEAKQNIKSEGVFWGSLHNIVTGNFDNITNPRGSEKEELRKINKKIEDTNAHRELLTGFGGGGKSVNFQAIDRIETLQTLMTFVQANSNNGDAIMEEVSKAEPKYVKIKKQNKIEKEVEGILQDITKEIDELAEESGLTENVIKSIKYFNDSEQTMYGYDQGDPITNLLAAMPKRDRDYFQYFVNAPDEERMKILELAPKYLRRPLEASWGIKAEKKTNLVDYFKNHALPGADWSGWTEETSLNAVRVKITKKEELDFSDVNVWQQDVDEANAAGKIQIPNINGRNDSTQIKNELYDVLGSMGLKDVQIDMTYSGTDSSVDLDLKYDTREKIKRQLDESKKDLIE